MTMSVGYQNYPQTRLSCCLPVHTVLRSVLRQMCDMSTVDFSVSCRTTRMRNVVLHSLPFTHATVSTLSYLFFVCSLSIFDQLCTCSLHFVCLFHDSYIIKCISHCCIYIYIYIYIYICIVSNNNILVIDFLGIQLQSWQVGLLFSQSWLVFVHYCCIDSCCADLQWIVASMPAVADFPLVPMHISEE